METRDVPQERNVTLGGFHKAVYARDESGRIVPVKSAGWEAEEIVTQQAVAIFQLKAEATRLRVLAGERSPLEYWMYARRMDLSTLAQSTGIWRWRIRRHFRPAAFAQLGDPLLRRYAEALGLSPDALRRVP